MLIEVIYWKKIYLTCCAQFERVADKLRLKRSININYDQRGSNPFEISFLLNFITFTFTFGIF